MEDVLIIRQPKLAEEFKSMFDLLWKVLEKPWNQPQEPEKIPDENEMNYFIALLNDNVIGTAFFYNVTETIGQIQAIAVEEQFRRKKIGSNMLQAIHVTARNRRMRYIVLNAREDAVKFFESYGYQIIEDGPLLFNQIKQFKMIKQFRK